MAVAREPAARGEFRVGRVLSTGFAIFFRHFIVFLVLSALAGIPAAYLEADEVGWPFGSMHIARSLEIAGPFVVGLVEIVLNALATSVVLFAAFQDMRGQPVRLGASLGVGLSRFLPVVGASLLMGIAVGLASLLLVIPGLIVFTMFYVGLPACVVEGLGPAACLSRSSELTKGFRWKIFGLALLLTLMAGVSGGLLSFILVRLGSAPAYVISIFVLQAFWRAVQSVCAVVAYHELRVAKEGIDIHRIASVFD